MKYIDELREVAIEKKSRIMKINFGPFQTMLVGVHPEAAKIILKSGTAQFLETILFHFVTISSFPVDPKSDDIYFPFLPWLGIFHIAATPTCYHSNYTIL